MIMIIIKEGFAFSSYSTNEHYPPMRKDFFVEKRTAFRIEISIRYKFGVRKNSGKIYCQWQSLEPLPTPNFEKIGNFIPIFPGFWNSGFGFYPQKSSQFGSSSNNSDSLCGKMKMRWLLALFCLLLALCQAQGDDVAPITDIQVTTAYFESSAKCKKGYDRIKQDLNSGQCTSSHHPGNGVKGTEGKREFCPKTRFPVLSLRLLYRTSVY